MLLLYRVKVADTKVTHFTPILALCTCLYRSHLQKLVSTKQTKHSRKSEAQNLCSKCPPFTRTYAFKRHHCTIAAAMTVWSSSLHPSADVLSTPSHHGSASGRRLNKHTPDAVVHQIQIWRIRWPHLWRDKLWRLSLQHDDSVTCTMCQCPILLKNVVISENRADIRQKHIQQNCMPAIVTADLNPWFQEVQLRSTKTGHCHRNRQRFAEGWSCTQQLLIF